MDLFANYEQEFVDTLSALQNRLGNLPSLTTDQKLNDLKKAGNEIREADETLQLMNLNARNVPGPQGAKLQSKIKEYEAETAKIKREVQRSEISTNETAARESLMGGNAIISDMSVSLDQRERLLNGVNRMDQSSTHLKTALRQANETIEVGTGIMSNLADQRSVMERGLDKLRGINDKLTSSSHIISGMARRVATNKMIMAFIVLVLLGAIGLIIWLKWFNK